MNENVEDQVRRYAEALYATATPIDQLAPTESPATEYGQVQVTLEPARGTTSRKPPAGLAVALVSAVVVLLAAVPVWLLARDGETASTGMQPPSPTVRAPLDPFAGVWVGTDGTDGSVNTLTVDNATNFAIYEETGVKACNEHFGVFASGTASGSATAESDTMTFTATLYCNLEDGRAVHPGFEDFTWVVFYDPVTDTVTLDADPNTTLRRSGNG